MNIIIIPARLHSTRLPYKMLLDKTGKALILHTIDRALESEMAEKIIVLTDSSSIADIVNNLKNSKVKAEVTPPAHSGTERISDYLKTVKYHGDDTIVNLQGDEPEMPGNAIDELLSRHTGKSVTTLATRANVLEMSDHNVVKVVFDKTGKALFFSRSAIPYGGVGFRHLGIYSYPVWFLEELESRKPDEKEAFDGENLEQLEWLYDKKKIQVVTCNVECASIDTFEQYERFVTRFRSR